MSQRLELRQSQSLAMTPQLLQAIKLLQMPQLELGHFVEQELERNPLLERDDDDLQALANPQTSTASETLAASQMLAAPHEADQSMPDLNGSRREGEFLDRASRNQDNQELLLRRDSSEYERSLSGLNHSADEIASRVDTDVDNLFPDEKPAATAAGASGAEHPLNGTQITSSFQSPGEFDGSFEAQMAAPSTLNQHLTDQMHVMLTRPMDRFIGQYLIDSLDEAGYLQIDMEEFSGRLKITPAHLSNIIEQLQSCEPTGVFARDLRQCLALQLEEKDRHDPAMAKLLDHLQLLAAGEFDQLQKICGVDQDDLHDMIDELKALNPRPGSGFGAPAIVPLIPDVILTKSGDGWLVELNSEALPKILVNQTYYAKILGQTRDSREKTFVTDCFRSANWLAKSLDQRAKTILKVASEIVHRQEAFFDHGVSQLRPMNLRQIAETVAMHESTISRVTAGKYMLTPRGTFELRYFFTAAINAVSGTATHSAEAVRHRIKQLTDEEDVNSILSDDTLVKLLKKEHIDIARRTVAKYREAIGISSSVERRRAKRARQRLHTGSSSST